jgi:predicted nucleic acid-binding protein
MRLVVDTGPLIARSKTGHLDLLPQLFDDIVIPASVLGEIAKSGETRPGSEVQNRSWIATLGVSIAERVELQQSGDIAAGEAEAILIAAEAPESTVLLVDERRARRIAIERGIHTLRTEPCWSPPLGAASCNPMRSGRRSRFFSTSGTWTLGRQRTSSPSCAMRDVDTAVQVEVSRFKDYLVALGLLSRRAFFQTNQGLSETRSTRLTSWLRSTHCAA